MSQSVERFSSRVQDYARYRPGYPTAIVDLLRTNCGLTPQSIIADIGSGTGKLSEIFLENGNQVFGVEPNTAMRTAAEAILSGYPNFQSISGTAESTNMPAASVDFVTAGQAFHWFDSKKAKSESIRILKPGGWALLVWNERQIDSTQFLRDYELLLLKYGTDYEVVRSENAVGAIAGFFSPEAVRLELFSNRQEFDFEGLRGRVVSSSYTPEPNHPNFKPMLARLRNIFDKHQRDGTVSIDYDTKVYYGHLRDQSLLSRGAKRFGG